jgi:hypothetical protein
LDIKWHIFTSTNNTTIILFPTQLWEVLYTYHVIKQCTEKETTSLLICLLTIKLSSWSQNYVSMFTASRKSTCRYGWILISCLNWKLQLFMCFWIIKYIFNHLIHHIFLSLITAYWIQNIHTIVFFEFIHEQSQVDYEESNTLFYIICTFLYR